MFFFSFMLFLLIFSDSFSYYFLLRNYHCGEEYLRKAFTNVNKQVNTRSRSSNLPNGALRTSWLPIFLVQNSLLRGVLKKSV